MMWVIGVALFALAILISVALHECGHMWVARATGMKVRRYFVGFGPTLWSTRRPNKLGYDRVRRQGDPARRLLRHRRHDVDRRNRAGRPPLRDVQAEDVEARGGAVRGPRHELHRRPGAPLRHRAALGLAQPEPAARRLRQPNRLCRTVDQQGRSSPNAPVSAPRPPPASRQGDVIVKVGDTDVHNSDGDGRRRARGSTARRTFVVDARRAARSPRSSTSPEPSASSATTPTARSPSVRWVSPAATTGPSSTRTTTR